MCWEVECRKRDSQKRKIENRDDNAKSVDPRPDADADERRQPRNTVRQSLKMAYPTINPTENWTLSTALMVLSPLAKSFTGGGRTLQRRTELRITNSE